MRTKLVPFDEPTAIPPVSISVEGTSSKTPKTEFTRDFRIGRDKGCDVMLKDAAVSREHAEVKFMEGRWWILDLKSTNGIFREGKKVDRVPIGRKTKVTLGVNGPVLTMETEVPSAAGATALKPDPNTGWYVGHYFDETPPEGMGKHTLMLRKAFKKVQKKQSRKYFKIIAVIGVLLLGTGIYAFLKHQEVVRQQTLAQEIFYQLKGLELSHAAFKARIAGTGDTAATSEVSTYLSRRKDLMKKYEAFVEELGTYKNVSKKDLVIFRVARLFGECEINMPDGFAEEVRNYIDLWKKSDRLKKAIQRAEENGYGTRISDAMISVDLPPQYFYLALQESDFDSAMVGPGTRFGIAKGMWQFIPSTATQYGLRTGPLVYVAKMDPRDERHEFDKSTAAAARYIRDIYDTEAQASGLLVMASYNWGHNVVKGLIRKMPQNPGQRNFWQFLKTFKGTIPKQTYDYVFYIFSAAVIGEDPGLFGFSFEKPLRAAEEKYGGG